MIFCNDPSNEKSADRFISIRLYCWILCSVFQIKHNKTLQVFPFGTTIWTSRPINCPDFKKCKHFFLLAFLLSARRSRMVGSVGPELAGARRAIYFNLLRDRRSYDQLTWLHPCTVSLRWRCRAALPAFGFWRMAVVFFSLYGSWNVPRRVSERYGGGVGSGGLVSGWNNDPSVLRKHLFCWSRTRGAGPGLSLLSTVKNEAFLNPRHSLCFPLGASDTLS